MCTMGIFDPSIAPSTLIRWPYGINVTSVWAWNLSTALGFLCIPPAPSRARKTNERRNYKRQRFAGLYMHVARYEKKNFVKHKDNTRKAKIGKISCIESSTRLDDIQVQGTIETVERIIYPSYNLDVCDSRNSVWQRLPKFSWLRLKGNGQAERRKDTLENGTDNATRDTVWMTHRPIGLPLQSESKVIVTTR